VAWNGTTSVLTGNTLTGNSQSSTPTLGSLGVSSPSALPIVLNAAEPATDNTSITVNDLALWIFSPTGTTLFTSDAFSTLNLNATQAGIGNSGFVFQLSAAEIARASSAFASATNRIGLSASLSNATGGPETFFAVNFAVGTGGGGTGNNGGGGGSGTAVPELGTIAIFELGLAAFGIMRRRSKL